MSKKVLIGLGLVGLGMMLLGGNPNPHKNPKRRDLKRAAVIQFIVDNVMAAERVLREKLTEAIPIRSSAYFWRIDDVIGHIRKAVKTIWDERLDEYLQVATVLDDVSSALSPLHTLYYIVGHACEEARNLPICNVQTMTKIPELLEDIELSIKQMYVMNPERARYMEQSLREIEARLKQAISYALRAFDGCQAITGKRCAFFYDDWKVATTNLHEVNLSMTALFNDLAYTVHRMAEAIATEVYEKIHDKPPVYVNNPDPELRDGVLTWAKAAEKAYELGLYMDDDFKALLGVVVGGRAWLRVGSAAGHATHIEKLDNTYKATYYDRNYNVNVTLSKLWRARGIETTVKTTGVDAEIPRDKLKDFFVILALATSMDIRIYRKGDKALKLEQENLRDLESMLREAK
jgi:hypothetical protein